MKQKYQDTYSPSPQDCEFFESGLEMLSSLQLIADALFMRLPKPSLK